MVSKKAVIVSVKFVVISFVVVMSITSYSYAGFYVVPVVKEVCTGIPVGAEAFILDVDSANLMTGHVYSTKSGTLVEIVGGDNVHYHLNDPFLVAPKTLPEPRYGVKGTFYYISEGRIAYANFL